MYLSNLIHLKNIKMEEKYWCILLKNVKMVEKYWSIYWISTLGTDVFTSYLIMKDTSTSHLAQMSLPVTWLWKIQVRHTWHRCLYQCIFR
jgi:hypothetical protein